MERTRKRLSFFGGERGLFHVITASNAQNKLESEMGSIGNGKFFLGRWVKKKD
jgi:hypothetical protein